MPRTPRWMQLARDAAYHVMSRGHDGETLFADADDFQQFLDLLDRYRLRFGVRLYHYGLMTNHFHLLVQWDDPRRFSSLMAGLLLAYGHHGHRRYGFVGHGYQGRFKSPLIQREGYWLSCGRYIERNPVEAGMVTVPWEYAWSSALLRAGGGRRPGERGSVLCGVEPGTGTASPALASVPG
jgi:putative transposase